MNTFITYFRNTPQVNSLQFSSKIIFFRFSRKLKI